MTVVYGGFEWDSEKAKANFKKHGIRFEDAVKAFDDPDFLEFRDGASLAADEGRRQTR